MFRNYLLICIVLSASMVLQPAIVSADSKDEAIKELVGVMNTMKNMETSLNTMEETIKINSPYFLKEIKIILERDLGQDEVAQAAGKYSEEDFGVQRIYELFRQKFNLEKITNEVMIPVYGEYYSEEEIRQLIDFYTSDLGQKTLRLTPAISTAIAEKTRDISHTALTQAKEELADELKRSLD